MTNWLIKTFVKDADNLQDAMVRSAYGKFAGIVGILANILLFVGKLIAGVISGALSIVADAFNNLSDAASSLVTLLGFKLSEAPPDDEHPFGHGRIEYLSGMALGALIIFAGFELGKSSFTKILHPAATDFSILPLAILVVAIFLKLWLSLFFGKIGKLISSDTVKAASVDSRNDILCTSLVLLSAIFEYFTGLRVDGYVGLAVAVFVVYTGIAVVSQEVSSLLGQAPDPELVEEIKETALSYDGIVGVHDLIVHNYGPGRVVISLHAEVPAEEDILKSHDIIDQVEKAMMDKFRAVTCIHMDPVDTSNPEVQKLKEVVTSIVSSIDERLSIHDFRVVFGETHTNLIFDVVIPFRFEKEAELEKQIQQAVTEYDSSLFIVTQIEHNLC